MSAYFAIMIVILDTNVIFENWLFDKPYHKAFLDYIGKVNCQVVFPQIVWSEVKALYCSQLKDALNKQASANRVVEKYIPNKHAKVQSTTVNFVDIDNSYNNYASYLLEILGCAYHSIIEYPVGILPLLAEKAIARIKPFSNSGEEFRDAILWHSVLEIAQEYEDLNPVVLISKNTREFSDANDKTKLHSELQYELEQLNNRNVLYYSSLEEFIKAHQTPIEHINRSWIIEHLPMTNVNGMVLEHIENIKEKIMPYFEDKYNDLLFDSDWKAVRFKLRSPGLSYLSQEETMYTYKNGDVSLFVEFDGTMFFGTSYLLRSSEMGFSKYDGSDTRVANISNYSPGYMEMEYGFYTRVEFKLKDGQLMPNGVAYFDLQRRYRSIPNGNGAGINDYSDLPF